MSSEQPLPEPEFSSPYDADWAAFPLTPNFWERFQERLADRRQRKEDSRNHDAHYGSNGNFEPKPLGVFAGEGAAPALDFARKLEQERADRLNPQDWPDPLVIVEAAENSGFSGVEELRQDIKKSRLE